MSLDREAAIVEARRPHTEGEADVKILDSTKPEDFVPSSLNQPEAPADEHTAVSQTQAAEVVLDAQHEEDRHLHLHKGSRNDSGDTRQSIATPQHQISPSEDVSLDLGVVVQEEEEVGMESRRHDDPSVEERRVAFLPPPRISPVFVPPRSSYPVGPPPIGSAYGTPPMGQIGVHFPREIVRIERDYSGGDLIQFYPVYPIELEGRITPTQWLDTVNGINEILLSAHSLKRAALDHVFSVLTLYISSLIFSTHYDKEMRRLRTFIDQCNQQLYHSQGLNILWPQPSGFLFMEIEYY